jgi:hypothetical protein
MWEDIHRRLTGRGQPIPLEVMPSIMEAMKQKVLLSPVEVALLYDQTVQSLAQMRCMKRGPRYIKEGKSVRYRQSDVEAYFAGLEVRTDA